MGEIVDKVYKMQGHLFFFLRAGTWILCKHSGLPWSFSKNYECTNHLVDFANMLIKQALGHGLWLSETRYVHGQATSLSYIGQAVRGMAHMVEGSVRSLVEVVGCISRLVRTSS